MALGAAVAGDLSLPSGNSTAGTLTTVMLLAQLACVDVCRSRRRRSATKEWQGNDAETALGADAYHGFD